MNILRVTHNAGFFSCCSIKLLNIIDYYKENKVLPDIVDSSEQFQKYKTENRDITYDFFKYPVISDVIDCDFYSDTQFQKYEEIDIKNITNYVDIYFKPSVHIENLISTLESKYNINYENTCAIYYRGNDKIKETGIGSYDDYFNIANEILNKEPNIIFLVQSDDSNFINEFSKKFTNSFSFIETPSIYNQNTSVHDTIYVGDRLLSASWFLAATIVVSKCKYLVTHSGNCGLWAILYRGNIKNTWQYLDHHKEVGPNIHVDYKGWIKN